MYCVEYICFDQKSAYSVEVLIVIGNVFLCVPAICQSLKQVFK